MFPYRRLSLLVCSMLILSLPATAHSALFGKSKPEPKEQDKSAVKPADPGAPPADAQFTLYCQAIPGPAHIEQANAAKDKLIEISGMKDWYIVHQDTQSIIYYGFYRTIYEAKDKDTARAQADRKRIDALTDKAGNKIFERPLFVQVESPDPAAPQEWNLLNTKGYWSLQIAAYKDSPARKQAAVDAVREARSKGVEAYYYHGDTTSSVCIGSWAREAVREQDESNGGAQDPTQDILVLPQALPAGQKIDVRNREGQRVRALAPKFDPIDPTMVAAKEQYPMHALNGEVRSKTIEDASGKREVEDPSFFVVIPRKAPSLLRSEPAPPTLVGPAGGPAPGASKLRSIGD